MNANDFEKQLQRQPFKTVPLEWRSEILQAARAAAGSEPSKRHATSTSSWREFLFLWRWHLAGLSATWLLIAVLNATQSSAAAPPIVKQTTASPIQVLMALRENRRQLLELIGANTTETSPALPTFAPRPRSERASISAMA
jgi:hypothetical protein